VRQASHISVISNSDMRAARSRNEVNTVFLLHTASADDAAAAARSIANNRQPEPRTAEFLAAPFCDRGIAVGADGTGHEAHRWNYRAEPAAGPHASR
jgi:hypothetical protein